MKLNLSNIKVNLYKKALASLLPLCVLIVCLSETICHAENVAIKNDTSSHQSTKQVQLSADEITWLSNHKVIRIAYDGALPPYSFINDAGNIDGVALEIMSLLSKRLAIQFAIYPEHNWTHLYKAAARRKVDIVATMVNRPERAEWFSFTKPYLTKSLVIVTAKNNNGIKSKDDLAGLNVAVAKGYQYGEQVSDEFENVKKTEVKNILESLRFVENGQADAAVVFLGSANYLQAKHQLSNLKIAAFYDRNSANESIAVRKDWPILVEILQKGLDSITEEEVQQIFAKWVVGNMEEPVQESVTKEEQPVLTKEIEPKKEEQTKISSKPNAFDTNFFKNSVIFLQNSKQMVTLGILFFVVLLAFVVWIFLLRKQKTLHGKAKNDMMTSVRNIQSIHNDSKHLTIAEAELDDKNDLADLVNLTKGEQPHTNEYIYYQHDCEGKFSYVSSSVVNILGYNEDDFMTNYRSYLTDNPVNRRIGDYIEECIQGRPNQPYEIEIYDKQQNIHWFEVMDSPVYDGRGHCIGVDGVMHEMTKTKVIEKPELKIESVSDSSEPQTKLLSSHLLQAIDHADRQHKSFALIYLVLDRLRLMDGAQADETSFEALTEAGKRLRATLRDTDSLIELQADNYALIMPETDDHTIVLVVEKIRKILQVPYLVGVQSIVLDANMGAAIYPKNGSDPQALIEQARHLAFVSDSQSETILSPETKKESDNIELQQDLVLALDECKLSVRSSNINNTNALRRHSQFSMHYQSIHNLSDYSIAGLEALIRWKHPYLGPILPAEFVPLVKDIGLLDVMTYWIVQQVSLQAVVWENHTIRPPLIVINLGDLGVKQAVEVDKVVAIIHEAGAKTEWFACSIPEAELKVNPEQVSTFIKRLIEAGLVVSIDNFGKDSTVLPILKPLPVQFVEIDPEFIRELSSNDDNAEILSLTVSMMQEQGKKVLGKEIETEEQLEFFKSSGCDMIQGYLLSRALPPKEAQELMENLPNFAWYFQQD